MFSYIWPLKNIYMKKICLLISLLSVCVMHAQDVSFTDVNFKTKLLSASPSNQIAKNLSGVVFDIDVNGDNQIQVSEALQVSELNLDGYGQGTNYITNISGIDAFQNLTKLIVTYQHIPVLQISNMPNLTYLDCKNMSQYIETLSLDNLPMLQTLYCNSNNQLETTSLTNLPMLKYINFAGCRFAANALDDLNALEEIYGYQGFKSNATSINLSGMPQLKFINFEGNSFSSVTFNPVNIIEKLNVNSNDLTQFDKTIFPHLTELRIFWNKLSSLDVSGLTNLTYLDCDNNGDIFASMELTSLNVQGCTSLETLICTRNRIFHLDVSGLENLKLLDCYGNYDVFSQTGLMDINLMNCHNMERIKCNGNTLLTDLDLSCSTHFVEIRVSNCANLHRINLKNGHIDNIYAGAFSRDLCPMLTVVGVDFGENISYLANTISQTPYYDFTPNCYYNTVIGNVRYDIDGNGCQDNNGIPGIKIDYDCPFQDCYTFTQAQGNFIIYTPATSITLAPQHDLFPLFDFGLTGPVALNFDSNTLVQYVDFCLAPNTVHNDLEITLVPIEAARPGFDSFYKILYRNKGNQVQNGTVTLQYDEALLDFVTAVPPPDLTVDNHITWNYANLMPFEQREIHCAMNINSPVETPPVVGGTILHYVASIVGSLPDETPDDMHANLNQIVVNSFDPNDKTCLEGNTIAPDMVGKYVHYLIRFENSGTANAQNIVIRDLIDVNNFDIATLTPLGSSHPMYSRVNDGNVAEFIFEDINLPFNDAANDGYLAFKIKTKPTLVVGNTFSNTASIYFDYNAPIVTNTATTTIQTILDTDDFEFNTHFTLYPNPANDILNIKSKDNTTIHSLSVYNTLGQLVLTVTNPQQEIDVSSLRAGNYLLRTNAEVGVSTSRFVKQ